MAAPAGQPRDHTPLVAEVGLSTLHDPQHAAIDIVFVHGLQGHPQATWTCPASDRISHQPASSPAPNEERRRRTPFRIFSKDKGKKGKEAASADTRVSDAGPQDAEPEAASSRQSSRTKDVYWPLDLLKEDLPTARIMTFGYNTRVTKGFKAVNQGNIFSHAKDLLYALETKRRKAPDRNLVFLAHSLGGILVKEVLRRSETHPDEKINKIFASTTGVFFFGTPHRGSDGWASFGEGVAGVASKLLGVDKNDQVIHALLATGPELELCRESFITQWVKRGNSLMVRTFQETKGIVGVRWGGFNQLIVPAYSSTLDHPNERARTVDSDHIGMVKFSSRDNTTYEAVREDLEELLDCPVSIDAPRAAHSSCTRSPVYYLPFSKNPRFVGRRDVLQRLEDTLFGGVRCQKMAIVGLGGAGKTQVALEFAQSVKSKWRDYSIFWMPVLSMESFEQACEEVASLLAIPRSADAKEDVKELVKRQLSGQVIGKWLMVVDNADDMQVVLGTASATGVADFLPTSDDGVLLYTSRRREVAQALVGKDLVEIGKMSEEEAETLLSTSLDWRDSDQLNAVKSLVEELDCLPLAITQAAAYINVNQSSAARYLELIRATNADLVEVMSREFRDSTRYRQSANAIATTWIVSFNQIQQDNADAADLLAFISFIESKAIPLSLLPALRSEARQADAVGTICSYAFMTRRDKEDVFEMHRLVHLAIGIWLGREERAVEARQAALKHVADIFPFGGHGNVRVWREYMPHAFRLMGPDDDNSALAKAELALKLGTCLNEDGRNGEAVLWLEQSCEWRGRDLAEDDADRLLSQHQLAIAYRANGQIGEAIQLLEHVVKVRKKLAEDHPSRLASQHNLAGAYQANEDIGEAIQLLEHIVKVHKKLAEDDLSRLASQHNLAGAYYANGNIDEAIQLLEHVVKVHKKLAEDHPDRLASQHQLAIVYQADGQINKAIQLLEHVVKIEEKLAEDHPDRLASQHVLAMAYQANGQIDEAIQLLEYVVKIKEKLVEDHPVRLASQQILAGAYQENRQIDKAIQLLEHVVKVKKSKYAASHPSRIVSEKALAAMIQ